MGADAAAGYFLFTDFATQNVTVAEQRNAITFFCLATYAIPA